MGYPGSSLDGSLPRPTCLREGPGLQWNRDGNLPDAVLLFSGRGYGRRREGKGGGGCGTVVCMDGGRELGVLVAHVDAAVRAAMARSLASDQGDRCTVTEAGDGEGAIARIVGGRF